MSESRREFLKSGAKSFAVAATLTTWGSAERVIGANDKVRVGIVGLRGRGVNHIQGYAGIPNVEIAALCDVDDNILQTRLNDVRKLGHQPKGYGDVRKLLDDHSIDVISIATPHHWHALIAVWACQAGKDVYVEKPCSHNLWEGRQIVRAATKYDRIVQHGTQSRSMPGVIAAMKQLKDECVVGDIYLARGLCFKWRDTIGHTPESPVPAGVDYNLWSGAAPLKPFTKNRFHYNWHWFWDYGNGDLGNQGIHQLDLARLGLGLGLPNKVSAMGGHFMFDDDQQTPNTLNCAFEYVRPGKKPVLLEFEVRHWMTNHEATVGAGHTGPNTSAEASVGGLGPHEVSYNSVGNIFYGPKGYLSLDNVTGFRTFLGKEQVPGPSGVGEGEDTHFENFISCVINRRKQDLRAPIEEGHITSALAHLANASYRLGRTLEFDPVTETVKNDDEANRILRGADRGYRAPFTMPESV